MRVLYRYQADAHHEWTGKFSSRLTGMSITCYEFPVRRETPRGVWIFDNLAHKERWVSLHSHKAYAYDTKEKALASFKIRNARHIRYLKNSLQEAELAYRAARTDELSIDVPPLFDVVPAPVIPNS